MRCLQCADPIQTADGIAIAGGNDAVAPLRCEEFTRFRAEIATDAETAGTPENEDVRRDSALRTRERAHALNHGDAIDGMALQAGVRSAERYHQGRNA
jgi:hypothetical protein